MLHSVDIVKEIIVNDQQTLDMLQPFITKAECGVTLPFEFICEYKYGDLHFGIQHAKINGTILKQSNGEWSATFHITDKYDFTELRNSLSLSNIAYNLGKVLQFIGSMSEFDIDLTVTIKGKE